LGERAADGLGRGELSQVYIEGENGTVFLISADDEAVLVAVAARGAKTGLMLFEVRRAAASVADALRDEVLPAHEDEVLPAYEDEFLAPYEDEAPPPYDEAPQQYEDEPLPAYDYYASTEPAADVPALQFVTKNGWSGQNGTAAETTSWS
ncbi:MAG: uncharacterized protein QOJ49_408, partial [Actinomycetota bacterium]|nr:uncharacterized protein [Actinomycetota bacterium]